MKSAIYSEAVTQAVLDNGRIYFAPGDSDFFPPDALGDRDQEGGGKKGRPVVITAGADAFECDIRYVSGSRIGPRSSFKRWLKYAGIRAGDVLQLVKVGERNYRLEKKP